MCRKIQSHRSEILFQDPVWCGDNSRVASTEINTHVHTQPTKFCMHLRVHILLSTTMQRDFKGGMYWDDLAETRGNIARAARFPRCGEISTKCGDNVTVSID